MSSYKTPEWPVVKRAGAAPPARVAYAYFDFEIPYVVMAGPAGGTGTWLRWYESQRQTR